jgi:hypothetical protein
MLASAASVAGFGRHVLGDCAFGVQAAFAGVDALRGLFDEARPASSRTTLGTISLWV